jgi:hypothetical protein
MQTLTAGTRPSFNLAVAYATRKRSNKTEQSAKDSLTALCFELDRHVNSLREANIKDYDYSNVIGSTLDWMDSRTESIRISDNIRECDHIISKLFDDHRFLELKSDHFGHEHEKLLGDLEGTLLEMDEITEQFIR